MQSFVISMQIHSTVVGDLSPSSNANKAAKLDEDLSANSVPFYAAHASHIYLHYMDMFGEEIWTILLMS